MASVLRNLIGSLDLRRKIISKLSVAITSLCGFAFRFSLLGLDLELSFFNIFIHVRCRSTHRYVGLQACSLRLVSAAEIRNLSQRLQGSGDSCTAWFYKQRPTRSDLDISRSTRNIPPDTLPNYVLVTGLNSVPDVNMWNNVMMF